MENYILYNTMALHRIFIFHRSSALKDAQDARQHTQVCFITSIVITYLMRFKIYYFFQRKTFVSQELCELWYYAWIVLLDKGKKITLFCT